MEQTNLNLNTNLNNNNMEQEQKMGGYFYYYLLVLVIIVSGVWLFWKGGETESPSKEMGQEVLQSEVSVQEANTHEGVLKTSDNPTRGNLMLASEGKDNLYISTVRDFNSLLGKKVEVRTEALEKGFKLLDIVAK